MKNVIVISAHPDDEVLGCGGTLLKHKAAGDRIEWMITTSVLEESGFSAEMVHRRSLEITEVKKRLGFSEVYQLGMPTMSLSDETMIAMIPEIGQIFKESCPEVIYVMNRSDAHSDHFITFKAVMACTKSFRYPSIKKVYMYECLSETEFGAALPENVFIPNHFVDVSQYQEEKLEIMQIYKSELDEHPFPRSIRNMNALATYRGASAGVEYAEAFQLLISIDK